MSENQSKMYTMWTAHHGQSGSIHVVDGDVLLIINDLTRQYLHPDTADSLATVFREAARDARNQRHDGGLPAMTDEQVRAMNRTVNDLVLRVAALERATCAESEPNSENAPMTVEQEHRDEHREEA